MNKAELIRAVAERSGITKKDAEQAVNDTLSVISDALVAGERVQLVGFGSFEVRERGPRQSRNPRTQEPMEIPASRAPVFKAGKTLKDAVAGKLE